MIAFLIGCTISITLSYFFSRFYRLKYSTSISLIIFLVSLILISICNYKSLNIVGNLIIGIGYVFLQFEGTFIHKIEHFSLLVY